MLRKSILALAAIATLSAAALAPTSASAGGKFWHKHHGLGFGFYPNYYQPLDCYWVKKFTPFGVRLVKVCSYY